MISKRGLISIVLAVFALTSLWHWWNLGQAMVLVDATTDRLSCVSYSPYHKPQQSPVEKSIYIDPRQIEADLTALARRFACVRTYSVGQGLHEVPRVAQQLGIKVLLGMWIGPKASDNEKELTRAVDLARKYPSTVRAIIVGNEVLLRGEQPATAIRAYLERVKSAVPGTQVSYADVWELWLRNQELADAVSFVTVHILPYWEDRPVDIDHAVGHVSYIYQRVKDELKGRGKDVMIGETGWPSFGRRRQGAVPSLVNQARFIREFSVRSSQENIDYNIIEAFDQPWKRQLEGAVGGYWGLYDAAGAPKFPFRGPVAEAPGWSQAAFTVMGLVFTGFAVLSRRTLSPSGTLALLAVSIIGGGGLTGMLREMVMTNRTPLEWAYTSLYAGLLLVAVFLFGRPVAAWCAHGEPAPNPASLSQLARWVRRNDQSFNAAARQLGALRAAFLFGAAIACLLLVFDARYRDFPLALFSAPAILMALLAWVNVESTADLEEMVLAGLLAFCGVWIAVLEHVVAPHGEPWGLAGGLNLNALLWMGECLMLAGSVLFPAIVELRKRPQL